MYTCRSVGIVFRVQTNNSIEKQVKKTNQNARKRQRFIEFFYFIGTDISCLNK